MSTIDDAIGKYLDEAVKGTPITSVASAILGLYLLRVDPQNSSHWAWLLSQDLAIGWEFSSTLKKTSVSTISLVIACAWSGPWLTRIVLQRLLRLARRSIEETIQHTYANARRLATTVGFKPEDFAIAQNWRRQHSKSLTRATRLSCFTYSLSAMSIATAIVSKSSIDLVVGVTALLLGTYASWRASLQFLRTYLPERILMDSSLGFPNVDLSKSVENAIKGNSD